jgi:hypothetical protein
MNKVLFILLASLFSSQAYDCSFDSYGMPVFIGTETGERCWGSFAGGRWNTFFLGGSCCELPACTSFFGFVTTFNAGGDSETNGSDEHIELYRHSTVKGLVCDRRGIYAYCIGEGQIANTIYLIITNSGGNKKYAASMTGQIDIFS